jgi:signal transduction histidine kinase/CheY-like chemotaxis protein
MIRQILRMELSLERDVVLARQRARQVAGLLGFDAQDQTRIATAVSEIARNAFQYAGGGNIEFMLESGPPSSLSIRIQDQGPGIKNLGAILSGEYQSPSGMGVGITGVRRLMDLCRVESSPGKGCSVQLCKTLPRGAGVVTAQNLANLGDRLIRLAPQNPFDEVRQQNQELLRTLDELRRGQADLAQANARILEREQVLTQLNRELEDTNRGVVALYAELDEKADFLRRASEMKSRFLSNMSHEFRTPLNAITGLTRLLLDHTDGILTPEQEKQVTLIRKAAGDLTELVNDLLDLAKVEAGKVTIQPTEFRVETLFGALRGMLRPLLAHNSSVDLVFEEALDLPELCTDESKVSQILRNFISNALKFTEQGEVRVSARAGREETIVFSVSDTGLGIAPEDQPRIFEEFTQVEGPGQKHVKGTGLGLPLVKKLAGLLGGHVELQSQPGVGSTFSVILPRVHEGPLDLSIVPELTPRLDPKRKPVLVVEDNLETLFIYERYLRGSGFQVVPARTLAAAQQALLQFRPVAVVLDVLLDGENTWGLLGELKQSATTRDIPILVVTLVENEAKARALGADAFCVKPVDRSWLLERLSSKTALPDHETVLVIEDDEASRYLIRGLLCGMNLGVIEARDGDEGLRLARQVHPRFITLDLDLPDGWGLDVMRQLQQEAATSSIPIIINSSQVLSERARHDMLAAGAAAVLSKERLSGAEGHSELQNALEAARLSVRTGPRNA